MKLTTEQLKGISSVIRNYSRSGYIPEFKTFMSLLNDKKFNELLRKDSPMSFLEQYLQDNKGRFCFNTTDDQMSSNTITIFYHLGNKGLYPEYDTILVVPPTKDTYGVILSLYYKAS